MKHVFFSMALVGLLALAACDKGQPLLVDGMTGFWKMLKVTDIATGNTLAKPATEPKDVTISFSSFDPAIGRFNGETPQNSFLGEYRKIASQLIKIEQYSITQVVETPWGAAFAANIAAIDSFSVDDNGLLNLYTPAKYWYSKSGKLGVLPGHQQTGPFHI